MDDFDLPYQGARLMKRLRTPSESQVMSASVAATRGSSSRRATGMIGNTWPMAQASIAQRNTAQRSTATGVSTDVPAAERPN